MSFLDTIWLMLLIPTLLVMLIIFQYSRVKRKRMLSLFTSNKLAPKLLKTFSPKRKAFKTCLFAIGIILIFLSLARPQYGHRWEEQHSKGIDIVFALDTSKSMLAQDIKPSRLERSKLAIMDLVEQLDGDRVALIAFSGSAFLQCPLTLDYNAFRQTLEATDTNVIQQGGTNIASAIQASYSVFEDENNFKFIVLITDGEDLQEAGLLEAREAAKVDITVYTVGVGSPYGDLIPIPQADGSTDYLRDADGKIVRTKLDEETLVRIADATGGFYTPLGFGGGLEDVYGKGLNTIPKQELSATLRKVPIERYQWPLAIAVFLFAFEPLISNRKRKVLSLLVPGLIAGISLSSTPLEGSVSEAQKAYDSEKFYKAASLYKKAAEEDAEDLRLQYNLGASYYQTRNYESAAHAFTEAVGLSDLMQQRDNFYNLGNAYYRIGERRIYENPAETEEMWEEALKQYESAMDIDESDTQARENYEFVKKKLEELQENPPQQPPEDNNEEEENEEEKEQDGSGSGGGGSDDSDNKENSESEEKGESQENQQKQQGDQDEKEQNGSGNEEENNSQNNEQKQQKKPAAESNHRKRNMTPEEARQLLKSMEASEKRLPLLQDDSGTPQGGKNYKDW